MSLTHILSCHAKFPSLHYNHVSNLGWEFEALWFIKFKKSSSVTDSKLSTGIKNNNKLL